MHCIDHSIARFSSPYGIPGDRYRHRDHHSSVVVGFRYYRRPLVDRGDAQPIGGHRRYYHSTGHGLARPTVCDLELTCPTFH
jgi:hypothetical protein